MKKVVKKQVEKIDKDIRDLSQKLMALKAKKDKLVKQEISYFKFKCSYDIILSEDEIWDNDAPDNPTTADVKKAIDTYGSPIEVIQDWNLGPACGDKCKITISKATNPDE